MAEVSTKPRTGYVLRGRAASDPCPHSANRFEKLESYLSVS